MAPGQGEGRGVLPGAHDVVGVGANGRAGIARENVIHDIAAAPIGVVRRDHRLVAPDIVDAVAEEKGKFEGLRHCWLQTTARVRGGGRVAKMTARNLRRSLNKSGLFPARCATQIW